MDSCRTWHEVEGRDPAQAATHSFVQPKSELVSELPSRGRVVSLAQLRQGDRGHISGIATDENAAVQIGDVARSTIARRLIELGFVAGEPIEVVKEVWPGGDPMAVRIGASLFALRRREAQSVLVSLGSEQAGTEAGLERA